MRRLNVALSLFTFLFTTPVLADDGWIFRNKDLPLHQFYDACRMLNEHKTVRCDTMGMGVGISVFEEIDDVGAVNIETAKLRYDIATIKSLAAQIPETLRIIDKSKSPPITALYLEKPIPLDAHCKEFKVRPWYCDADEPPPSIFGE
ncbi:MAG: hypothetical protein CBB87_08090 [Micavibrio sp. TMED27]|nr:hypothetical protein [Micavibrio sp.]OUT90630.1 MAG: hypothetical protein CBB87_08090 [Micavibrio sp. TMED27]|tara:strand:- start:60 stop:500 length:441 start_codon:yes stop_codon:yes gene_type:complete